MNLSTRHLCSREQLRAYLDGARSLDPAPADRQPASLSLLPSNASGQADLGRIEEQL